MVYKLTYFNTRNRAEVIRLVFALAQEKFEDVRIEFDDWTDDVRDGTPTGWLPILDEDGFILTGSLPIARYLAAKFGLMGQSERDHARIDMILDLFYDFQDRWAEVLFEEDKDRQEELKQVAERYNRNLDTLERLLQKSGGDYFLGAELSLADLMAFALLETYSDHLTDEHPGLKALMKRLEERPRIQEWVSSRPVSDV